MRDRGALEFRTEEQAVDELLADGVGWESPASVLSFDRPLEGARPRADRQPQPCMRRVWSHSAVTTVVGQRTKELPR
jgi:hypothetical protein